MFNHSDEDLPIKMDDRIAQLVFEQINTPDVQEVEKAGRKGPTRI